MSGSFQRQWLTDILESTPSIVFFALLRSGIDLETAGWTAAALAAAVLLTFRAGRLRFNPILLGINTHLLLVTPVIVALHAFGAAEFGRELERMSFVGVLVTIFVVGLMLSLISRDGFVGQQGLSVSMVRRNSAVLLAGCLAAIAWSFLQGDNTLLGVALPVVLLFALRRLLIARSLDKHRIGSVGPAVGGAVLAGGVDFDGS